MHTLAANVVWDATCHEGRGPATLHAAIDNLQCLLAHVADVTPSDAGALPQATITGEAHLPDRPEWDTLVERCLQSLDAEAGSSSDGEEPSFLDGLNEQALKVCAPTISFCYVITHAPRPVEGATVGI